MKVSGYIDILLQEFNQYYTDLCLSEQLDEFGIHELRVAYKQIFALYKILFFISPECTLGIKEDIQQLKYIFKKSGEIRDRQIILSLVTNLRTLDKKQELIKMIHKDLNKLGKSFTLAIRDYSYNYIRMHLHQTFSILDVMKKSSFLRQIEEISEQYNQKIERTVASKNIDFHKVRHFVKQQYYLLEMYNHLTRNKYDLMVLKRLKKLGKLLGDWHDLIILKNYLTYVHVEISQDVITKVDKKAHQYIMEIKPILPILFSA